MAPFPPGYAEVVRAHHAGTVAYLLATSPACHDIRVEERRRVRRRIELIDPDGLAGFAPKGSWLLGVLLCPGNDTGGVAAWALGRKPGDLDRVRFYHHPRTPLGVALSAWIDAGLGPPLAAEVRDFSSFHKVFGKHLNDRVWLDHA